MKSLIILCVVVAVAIACPCPDISCNCKDNEIDDSDSCINLPSIIPSQYKVKTFDSQYATIAFQGLWYVKWATPTIFSGPSPLRMGLFSNIYPCTNNRLMFQDTTPNIPWDYNTDYKMVDTSFNVATGQIITTRALFKSAYGKNSPYAIFNIGTPKYYDTPLKELNPFTDDHLFRHPIGDCCDREFTVAVIAADDDWAEYMVFAVINQYDNFFCGNDKHIFWVLTRDANPDYSVLSRVMSDLCDSGINPYYLMSMDHSIDLTTIPSLTPDDINGLTCFEPTPDMPSPFDFQLNPSYQPLCDYDNFDLLGDDNIKILKNISPDDLSKAITGQYYLASTVPSMYDDFGDDSKVGLFNTGIPACSIQVIFDNSQSGPWDYKTPVMMVDRGYNWKTGKVDITRSVIRSSFDSSVPYPVFTISTEGYYKNIIQDLSPITYDGINWDKPSDLYRRQYIVAIVGYKQDKFIFLYIVNKYKNMFYPDQSINQLFVMTRDRIRSPELIADINQEILRCGYNTKYLINVDQTREIPDVFNFDKSYFQLDGPTNLPRGLDCPCDTSCPCDTPNPCDTSCPCDTPNPCDTSCPCESSNPCDTSCPCDTPCPCESSNPCDTSCPCDEPCSDYPLPSIIPPNYKVKTFDSQKATTAFQGTWYVRMATPTYVNGQNPLQTGLFSNSYPCSNTRLLFQDTTPENPWDYNTDYTVIDSSFNLATQRLETTTTHFKSAYGKNNPYAIFNFGTKKSYPTPLKDLHPLVDDSLFRHPIDDECDREFTVAIIAADDCWGEYMVLIVINQYDILCSGNDDHILWILTRDSKPDYSVLDRAMDDIKASGLNPYNLISMDHSIDLSTIPNVTEDDIHGVFTSTTTTTTTTTKSISSDSGCDTPNSSTTSTTITSTVELTLNNDYKPLYENDNFDLLGDNSIKILKNISPEDLRKAISGQYYITSTVPCALGDDDDFEDGSRVGLFRTGLPASSLQVIFDSSNENPWDYDSPVMMLDRGYNWKTGKVDTTRSIIRSSFDSNSPYPVFTISTEGYYKSVVSDISPITFDGINWTKPCDLYHIQYIAVIVGYKPDAFVLFYIVNKYKNLFYPEQDVNQFYVMTRDRICSPELIDDINQEILRCGFDLRYLVSIDQTLEITDPYEFTSSYFQFETSSSSTVSLDSSGYVDIDISGSTVTTKSSSLSVTQESSVVSGSVDCE